MISQVFKTYSTTAAGTNGISSQKKGTNGILPSEEALSLEKGVIDSSATSGNCLIGDALKQNQ
jgi:hypothetical protein